MLGIFEPTWCMVHTLHSRRCWEFKVTDSLKSCTIYNDRHTGDRIVRFTQGGQIGQSDETCNVSTGTFKRKTQQAARDKARAVNYEQVRTAKQINDNTHNIGKFYLRNFTQTLR